MILIPNARRLSFWFLAVVLQLVSFAPAEEKTIRLSILDSDNKRAIPARVYLNSRDGTPFYFSVAQEGGSAVQYTKQSRVNDQSVEYHTTVSAHPCFAKVPSGNYLLTIESGKSYLGFSREFAVTDQDVELVAPLKRVLEQCLKELIHPSFYKA